MLLFIIIVCVGAAIIIVSETLSRLMCAWRRKCVFLDSTRAGSRVLFPEAEVATVPQVVFTDDPLRGLNRTLGEPRRTPLHGIRSVQFDLEGEDGLKEEGGQLPQLYVVTRAGHGGYLCRGGYWHSGSTIGSARNMMSVDDLLHHAVVFMDAKSAHDYARRSRYHIPQWWEWIIVGGVVLAVFAEGARLFIGDAGLLSLLRR